MTATRAILSRQSAAERDKAVAAAAEALMAGRLVIVPTETVYGVAANAAAPAALEALAALRASLGRPKPTFPGFVDGTWHAGGSDAVAEALDATSPVHRRILDRLTPGPVRLIFEKGDAAAGMIARLGAVPGAFDREGNIAVRVPDHPLYAAVAQRAGVPVIVERLSSFGWGAGRDVTDFADKARAAGIAVVLDDGPTRLGKPSAVVRLTATGGYSVLADGAWDARTIHKRIERTILFVCTGNTCRSPMAEAIARAMIERTPEPRVPTRIASAGTSAAAGAPISEEAAEVLAEMNYPMARARARELTRDMIAQADVIYAMTRGHARSVLDIEPGAADKVFTIDPRGSDVPDPIGGPVEVYRQTAARLEELIAARLEAMNGPRGPERRTS